MLEKQDYSCRPSCLKTLCESLPFRGIRQSGVGFFLILYRICHHSIVYSPVPPWHDYHRSQEDLQDYHRSQEDPRWSETGSWKGYTILFSLLGCTTLSLVRSVAVCPLLAAALPTTLLPRHGSSFRATAVFRFVFDFSKETSCTAAIPAAAAAQDISLYSCLFYNVNIVCQMSGTVSLHHG